MEYNLGSVRFFFIEMNTFIQQGCNKLQFPKKNN